jgi:hypothetical protein
MKEGENLHSTPPDMEALVVDLDEPTRRLLAAVQKALSDEEWLHGGLRAVRIGDEVRRDMSITASEIAGPEATGYLERVIRELESEAARSAKHGWGRYRTLWYLRRLPLEMFAFGSDLATTAPYDLRLTEVLMTRGSDSMAVPKKLDAKGCFPIDESVARRLAREMGFSKSVSEYHRHYRRCAKGAILRFERPGRPPLFSMPEDVSSAVRLYDERRAEDTGGVAVLGGLGTPALEDVRSMGEGDDVTKKLILVYDLDEAPVPLKIEVEHEGRPAKMLIPAYRIARVSDLETLAGLMSDPRVGDPSLWHEDMPLLVALLNLEPIVFHFVPGNRPNLFKQGYTILSRGDIERLWNEFGETIRSHIRGYLGRVAYSLPESGGEFLSRLLAIEGDPWPLASGPVAFRVKEDRFGLDMTNATRRLITLLEYPSVGGEVANLRAGAFERATQQMIDATPWRPPEDLSRYRGRHLRLGGKTIGEPDAIAERDGACLMVSCKSRVYTAAYDVGHHNVVRNTAEHIAGAVAEWEAFVGELRRNPVGDNYDLSGVRDLRGVVITPTVFYVPMEVVKKKTAEDLRYYSSLGELESWLSRDMA